jgi:hypothetical protein
MTGFYMHRASLWNNRGEKQASHLDDRQWTKETNCCGISIEHKNRAYKNRASAQSQLPDSELPTATQTEQNEPARTVTGF